MIFQPYLQNAATINERIQKIRSVNFDSGELRQVCEMIYSCIDLTSLDGTDNPAKIKELCSMAQNEVPMGSGVQVAAVCVYIPLVSHAVESLKNNDIQVATVACAFPSGQLPLELKLGEVRYAVAEGAQEIDMVISRGAMLANDFETVLQEVSEVKKACGKAHLKVILETGELQTVDLIRKASELAILGGADFIKTSTGKVNPAATPEAVVVMLDTIKEYFEQTGIRIGLKPAGGIADPDTAIFYYQLVSEIVGDEWLTRKYFRIGASRLADKLRNILTAV